MNPRLKLHQKELKHFCQKWRVRELSLFGSALRNDFGPESDLDFLVSFEKDAPWSLFDIISMKDEMEKLFGRSVDIIEKEALRNPWRKREILNSREVIYAA